MTEITAPLAYVVFSALYILFSTVAILVLSRAYWRELNKNDSLQKRIWAASDALREE